MRGRSQGLLGAMLRATHGAGAWCRVLGPSGRLPPPRRVGGVALSTKSQHEGWLTMAGDEWTDVSLAELDSLERSALRQVAERRSSTSTASSSLSPYSSPHKVGGHGKRVSVKVFHDEPGTGRIVVESPYSQDVLKALKSVPGHEWNQQRKVWTFPLACSGQLGVAFSSVSSSIGSLTVVPPLTLTGPPDDSLQGPVLDRVQLNSPLKLQQVFEASPVKLPGTPGKLKPAGSPSALKVEILIVGPGVIAARSPYNQALKLAYQSVEGRKWDVGDKVWTFPIEELPSLMQALQQVSVNIQIEAVPPLELPEVQEDVDTARSSSTFIQSVSDSPPQRGYFKKCSCSVSLSQCADSQIAAKFDYQQDVVAAMRTVPSARWHSADRVWKFPSSSLTEAGQLLRSLPDVDVQIDAVPPLEMPCMVGERYDNTQSSTQGAYKSPREEQSLNDQELLAPSRKRRLMLDYEVAPYMGRCTVKLILHSSGQIIARFEYQQDVTAAMRNIPHATWNSSWGAWMFPFSSLAEAEKTLGNVKGVKVTVLSLDPLVRRAVQASAALPNLEEKYTNIPEHLKTVLMPFQQEGVRFALQHGGRVLIGDEMGLGKTLQAIAVASCLEEDWPVLIIVPPSLRIHWAAMIKQWLHISCSQITVVMSSTMGSNPDGFNIVLSAGKHTIRLDRKFNIISYDIAQKLVDEHVNLNFKVVIADESHYMKNAKAKRTNACVPLLQKAKYAVLLTGTPALSRPIELFKQLEALYPTVYREVSEYGNRYCQGGAFGAWQGASNHEELHALIKSTVMIRRLKKDVLTQLPRKRRQQVFLTVDVKSMKQLRALFNQLKGVKEGMLNPQEPGELEKLKFAERNLLTKIYAESAVAKVPAVEEYLATVLEADCKFLIFAHHMSMLDGIHDFLQKKKVMCIRIDGNTPVSSRHKLVEKFQTEDNVKAAVLGIRAAGIGLTLTAASTVIFAEMSWTPGDLVQAEDRAHRIGQESAVNVYYLHAHDTIDSIIWDLVRHKLENLGQVLDGREATLQVAADDQQPSQLVAGSQLAKMSFTSPLRQSNLDGFLRASNNRNQPPADVVEQ